MRRSFPRIRALWAVAIVTLLASPVVAQEIAAPGAIGQQSLRPYWHVFVAYAIAIVLVMAWAGSIAKRLADVEQRLGE